MPVQLDDYQIEAIHQMTNGCILNGGVGSGKSRTALAYYINDNGGNVETGTYPANTRDLYIITTAKKRDSLEWEEELRIFGISINPEINRFKNKIVIDSWNNIQKYKNVYGAFFIFDEQRVVGKGAWVKSFLNIARKNRWILLSATPGDTWSDYIPVFMANGFFKSKTEFYREHCIFNPYVKYPLIDRYTNVQLLEYYRKKILINMDYKNDTTRNHLVIFTEYDKAAYKKLMKDRFNPWTNEPMINASELCYCLRRCVNEDISRQNEFEKILSLHEKIITFYNFDYELELLINILEKNNIPYSQWNGHRHEKIPQTDRWVYLVQYTAGAEGWNCIETDTIIFYSQNYSYKTLEQACGRIDRRNTPFNNLFYYHLRSTAPIDIMIKNAINNKKKFNERGFVGNIFKN